MAGASRTVEVIIRATADDAIRELNKTAGAVDGLDKSVSKAGKGTGFATLGAAAKGMGVATALGVAAAVKSYAAFDKAMSSVASTGLDAKSNLEGLREAALKAGADTKYSATEAAQGVEALLKAGVSAKDVMSGGLSGALDLAAAGGQSVADAAETAATAMTQFKLSGSDVGHVADLMAAGAGKAQGEVSDLAAALNQSGLVASSMGMSIEETTGALSAFASAGLLGSDAGTSLKTMLQRLGNPSAEAAETMKSLGINAYGAQGQFVGLEGVAGQLQNSMAGLSQEQRDAAMATIFGSDAVRAANVLYQQGSAGIADWTNQVNQAGYAQQVAAAKMDNLAGDWEQFTGSVETASIKIGEAANGPLRQLVQGLTGLVNAAGEHPRIAQGILGIAAAVTTLGVGAVGIAKVVSATRELRGAFQLLGSKAVAASLTPLEAAIRDVNRPITDVIAEAERAAEGIDGTGSAASRAGTKFGALVGGLTKAAALYGAVAAAGALANEAVGKGSVATQEATTALSGMAQGSTAAKAQLDALFDAHTTDQFNAKINDTATAFQALEANSTWFNKSITWAGQLVNIDSTLQQLRTNFSAVDQSLASMESRQAAQVFSQLAQEAQAAGLSVEQVRDLFPQYAAAVTAAAGEQGQFNLSAQQIVDIMSGQLPAGMLASASASTSAATSIAQVGQAAALSADQLKELNAEQDQLANDALGLSGAQMSLASALAAATKSAKDNGNTLNINTEKGRANKAALDNVASAALSVRSAMEKQGASTSQVNAKTASARAEFVRVAQQMGMTKDKANQLANSYGLVPRKVTTNVTAPGADVAKVKSDALRAALLAIPASRRAEVISAFDRGGVEAARNALNAIDGKVATTYIRTVQSVTKVINQRIVAENGRNASKAYAADGGIFESYADGGVRERHRAQIAPAGAMRVWAEPETGGEAYIPLAQAKRGPSMNILEEVARRFGRQLVPMASGGILSASASSTPNLGYVWGLFQRVTAPLAELASAMSTAAKSSRDLAAANQAAVGPSRQLATATKALDGAKTRRTALGAKQKSEDLAYQQAILNAQKGTGAALLASLRGQAKKADADLAKRIVAATKTGNKQLAASLGAQRKTTDAEYDVRIAKAQVAATKGKAGVSSLQQAKKQSDINQQRDMAKATAAVTAATKAKTAAEQKAAPATAKAKAALDAYKQSQSALAQVQQQMAAEAHSTSTQLQQGYRSGGDTLSEWMSGMTKGALSQGTFAQNMMTLANRGLDKQVLDDLYGRGADQAATIVSQLLTGGAKAIAEANSRSRVLDKYADALAWQQTTGTAKAGTVTASELARLRAQVAGDSRNSTAVALSAEVKRMITLLMTQQPIQVIGSDAEDATRKMLQQRNDQLARAGIR